MKLAILTIALDAMPWITQHLREFDRIPYDWTWHIIEGAAMNHHDTSWCRPQRPRLSTDGTSQYLDGIASHPRVRLVRRQAWDGKREMVNEPLSGIREPCILLEVDADECWRAETIAAMVTLFAAQPDVHIMRFRCNYFVGPNIVCTRDGSYGNRGDEWTRAWRYEPGMRFVSHEPPVLSGPQRLALDRHQTSALGLTFDHYAYALEKQVAYKAEFYGYKHAVQQWQRLQKNSAWPAKLRDFLPWVDDEAVADLYRK